MAGGGEARWTAPPAAAAIAAAISALFAFSASLYWRSSSARFASRVRDLEASLKDALDKAASERRGRTRAQKALRESLLKLESAREADEDALSPPTSSSSYPMVPIGVVHSCFTTRNGTPRQPLVVPLARARLILNPNRAPPDALEGFAEYSHCWVLYIFHLNTDLEKLWKPSCRSKFKAKVRVPRLKGGKMGVLATRSPHRPCPIGLTVAKVEAVDGGAILLSGVDLVDGTPVLDIKPYLPYSDCIKGAAMPQWLEEDSALKVASVSFSPLFSVSLAKCWETAGPNSMYACADEMQCLIKQVLSWDIRSFAQRSRPHLVGATSMSDGEGGATQDSSSSHTKLPSSSIEAVAYHLVLEGIDIKYQIDADSNVIVEKATICDKNGMRT